MSRSIRLELPYPPSANRLWRAVNGRQIKSGHYRLWLLEAVTAIRATLPNKGLSGPYRLMIQATAPDRRRRDLDNIIKPVGDALTQAGVVTDDCHCRELNVLWTSGIVKGGHVLAIVTEVV
ncbi:MAG: RusA family crossover junction endodeoxyribonuclease [Ignavibacteriales bacterium]